MTTDNNSVETTSFTKISTTICEDREFYFFETLFERKDNKKTNRIQFYYQYDEATKKHVYPVKECTDKTLTATQMLELEQVTNMWRALQVNWKKSELRAWQHKEPMIDYLFENWLQSPVVLKIKETMEKWVKEQEACLKFPGVGLYTLQKLRFEIPVTIWQTVPSGWSVLGKSWHRVSILGTMTVNPATNRIGVYCNLKWYTIDQFFSVLIQALKAEDNFFVLNP